MEEIQEITECCICTDLYTDPRMLPCIHTFCLKCLQDIASKSGQVRDGKMPCPICRKLFAIPSEGGTGLKKNFFMERLVEITKISKPSEEKTICEKCAEFDGPAGDVPLATKYCIECHENICNRCCRDHERFKELKKHQLVEFGSQMKNELMRKLVSNDCKLHAGKQMDMYCKDCKQVVCVVCFAENHQMHKCSDIEKMAEEFRKRITDCANKINAYSSKASANNEELLQERTEFMHKVDETEKDIIHRAQDLKDLVEKYTRSLLDELASIKHRTLKEMDIVKGENERQKIIFESFTAYCTEMNSNGSAGEICCTVNDLKSRADELEEMYNEQKDPNFSSIVFSFVTSKSIEDSLKAENIVGKFKEISVKYTKKPKFLQKTIPQKGLRGLALLNGELFTLSDEDGDLTVYDSTTLKVVRAVSVQGLTRPADMASHQLKNCLYTVDFLNLSFFCIDKQGKVLRTWKLPNVPVSLSVTPSGNIIVTYCVQKILEYNSEGTLLRDLQLYTNSLDISQTILLSSGNFLVCAVQKSTSCHGVLNLDPQGNITGFCVSDQPHSGRKLSYPVYLSMNKHGYIFVADMENDSVVLLNEELVFIKKLLTQKDGINSPRRILLDESSGRFYVCDNYQELSVFEMNY